MMCQYAVRIAGIDDLDRDKALKIIGGQQLKHTPVVGVGYMRVIIQRAEVHVSHIATNMSIGLIDTLPSPQMMLNVP